MKGIVLCACLALLVFLTPSAFPQPPAQAQQAEPGGSHEGQSKEQGDHWTLWKWANFAILAVALGYGITKKAGPFFGSRTEEIQKGIAEASRLKQEAEARAVQVKQRLSNLGLEIEALWNSAREEIAAEGERVRAETEQDLKKIQAHAEQEIASAGQAARQELKAYSAELALGLAGRKIRERLTPGLEGVLVSSFVTNLERRPPAGGAN